MINTTLSFTYEEAKQVFESTGLEVRFCEAEIDFKSVKQKLFVWIVANPHTGEPELLDVAFRRYLESVKDRVLPNIDKLEVYNSFSKSKV